MSDSRFEIVIFYLEVLVVLFDLLLEDDELGISCAQVFIFDPGNGFNFWYEFKTEFLKKPVLIPLPFVSQFGSCEF